MRRYIVDNLLISFYIINAIMPICDDSGIIPGAGFPVGILWLCQSDLRFQVDPTKLCFGSPFSFQVFFFVVCFVKLSDPAALKLNNKMTTRIKSFIILTSYILIYIYIYI